MQVQKQYDSKLSDDPEIRQMQIRQDPSLKPPDIPGRIEGFWEGPTGR
jgi:hypothetical protein